MAWNGWWEGEWAGYRLSSRPEVAAQVQALMIAVQHVDSPTLLPGLLIQGSQQHEGSCIPCSMSQIES